LKLSDCRRITIEHFETFKNLTSLCIDSCEKIFNSYEFHQYTNAYECQKYIKNLLDKKIEM